MQTRRPLWGDKQGWDAILVSGAGRGKKKLNQLGQLRWGTCQIGDVLMTTARWGLQGYDLCFVGRTRGVRGHEMQSIGMIHTRAL